MIFGGTKAVEMPPLYEGWFDKTRFIEKSIVGAVKSSYKVGQPIEVLFPSLPNLDEVSFGTKLNQEFGTMAAKELGMPAYKPGSKIKTYLVQFSNIYWAKRLAEGIGSTVWGLCTDGLKKDDIKQPGKLKLASINKPESFSQVKKGDTVIVIQPGTTEQWKFCLNKFSEQKLIFLNAPVTSTYDLGGPVENLRQAYYCKRVSKGWAFICSPGPWTAYIEKPDRTVEKLRTYDEKPSLSALSKEVREESFKRYAIFNDRYAPGFGGRI
eukprot:CAMPEP_0171455796 /NCGR_PEP_ID=MMETSP0945-20130129/2545_1 /TAXON_ID=109269 /ORGANISM="Vaucheria litorea, Strain CCMP2940" /LENGTH=266 /DNA_ID=CAMNT_0011981103 /DNA_START=179 /DNA_END=979 /DNA_ORIENTATION=-